MCLLLVSRLWEVKVNCQTSEVAVSSVGLLRG